MTKNGKDVVFQLEKKGRGTVVIDEFWQDLRGL
jgi:hypothetical protein